MACNDHNFRSAFPRWLQKSLISNTFRDKQSSNSVHVHSPSTYWELLSLSSNCLTDVHSWLKSLQFFCIATVHESCFSTGKYLIKVTNKNTSLICWISSKLAVKISGRRELSYHIATSQLLCKQINWLVSMWWNNSRRPGVFAAKFKLIQLIVKQFYWCLWTSTRQLTLCNDKTYKKS